MKRLHLWVLLVLTTVIASGCIKGVLRFQPDGSGQMEIAINLSIQSLEEAESLSEDGSEVDDLSLLLDSGESLTDPKTGISISAEERLENGNMWTYIIITVPTIDAWQEVPTTIERMLPTEEGSDPTDPANLVIIPDVTVENGILDVEFIAPGLADPNTNANGDPFSDVINAFIQISYEIEMPGTVTEHNGQVDSLTGNLVWLLDSTSTKGTRIQAQSALD